MIKNCVVCGIKFDARGTAITCGKLCSDKRKKYWQKRYESTMEQKEHRRKYDAKKRADPIYKELRRVYNKKYRSTEKYRAHKREWYKKHRLTPKRRAYIKKYQRKWSQERQKLIEFESVLKLPEMLTNAMAKLTTEAA
jgi:hypothetical protein